MFISMVLCSEVRQIALSSSVNVELDATSALKTFTSEHFTVSGSTAGKVKQLDKPHLRRDEKEMREGREICLEAWSKKLIVSGGGEENFLQTGKKSIERLRQNKRRDGKRPANGLYSFR